MVRKHLGGELQDFREVPVDLSPAGEFDRLVYQAAMQIPAGETRMYGEIARAIGRPSESRAVGQALARNPIPIIIPCHRVLAANGRLGGFSAPGALQTKTKLLSIEGARFPALLTFPA
jgi:methylated-DNA-[protein]-cysteine S-methyltransferase